MKATGGKLVVITGASSGIGEASAHAFARKGCNLVLAARNKAALDDVAEVCRRFGCNVLVVPTDVTKPQQVKDLAMRAAEFGPIDIWVSNVGVGAVGQFHQTPMKSHEQVIKANLIGHMNDAHAVLPFFLRQGYGVFINMISLGGFAAAPYAAAYSASKFGLKGFSEALRAELSEFPKIHVCDIYPAFVDTPGISHGANYVGRELTAPPPVYDARKVARAIVRTSEHPRDATIVGLAAAVVRLAHFLAPSLSTRLMAWAVKVYFRRAPPIAMTDGNLFKPPVVPGGVDGGLRSPRQRAAGAVGTLIVGTFIVSILLRRKSSGR